MAEIGENREIHGAASIVKSEHEPEAPIVNI